MNIAHIVKCCIYIAATAVGGVIVLGILGMIYPFATSTAVAIRVLGTIATSALGTAAFYVRRIPARVRDRLE